MTKYTVGFLFEDNGVWLIRKNRPAWQAGRLNGIGGHMEEGESPLQCQIREFREETGATFEGWKEFAVLTGPHYLLYCFYGRVQPGSLGTQPITVTDETVSWFSLSSVKMNNPLDSLMWKILLALDCERNPWHAVVSDLKGVDT